MDAGILKQFSQMQIKIVLSHIKSFGSSNFPEYDNCFKNINAHIIKGFRENVQIVYFFWNDSFKVGTSMVMVGMGYITGHT